MNTQSIVFGVRKQVEQPTMYELLSWSSFRPQSAPKQPKHDRPSSPHVIPHQAQNKQNGFCDECHSVAAEYETETQHNYKGAYLNSYQDVNAIKELVKRNKLARTKSQTLPLGSSAVIVHPEHVRPIKVGVYEGDDDLYRSQLQKSQTNHDQIAVPQSSREKKTKSSSLYKKTSSTLRKGQKVTETLDPDRDKEVIARRMDRIKEFKLQSRDLPNSAFATYYGKPPFEAYGRGSRDNHLMTHNVMPHAGDNKPRHQQTYTSALTNAPKETYPHIPRKKHVEGGSNCKTEQLQVESHEGIAHIDIKKPDLLYVERFITEKEKNNRQAQKAEVAQNNKKKGKKSVKSTTRPASGSLNPKQEIPAGMPSQHIQPVAHIQSSTPGTGQKENKPAKKNKVNKYKTEEQAETERLKFMNMRKEGFMKELIDKKMRSSRLAYKVTESYPVVLGEQEEQLNDPRDYAMLGKKWVDTMIVPAGKESKAHVPLCFY